MTAPKDTSNDSGITPIDDAAPAADFPIDASRVADDDGGAGNDKATKSETAAAADEDATANEEIDASRSHDPKSKTKSEKAAAKANKAATRQPVTRTPFVPVVADETAPKSLVAQFLKASGYEEDDVLSSHEARRTFVTKNGGKYSLNTDGKTVYHLMGPAAPKMVGSIRLEEEARREAAENAGAE